MSQQPRSHATGSRLHLPNPRAHKNSDATNNCAVKLYPNVDPQILLNSNPTHLLCFPIGFPAFFRRPPSVHHRITDARNLHNAMADGTVEAPRNNRFHQEVPADLRRVLTRKAQTIFFYARFWKICLIQTIMFSTNYTRVFQHVHIHC